MPISFFVIFLSVVIAFSNLLRALLWSLFALVKTWLLVQLKIYSLWLDRKEKLCSTSVMRWTEEMVRKMKEEVEITKRKKKRDKREKGEGKKQSSDGKHNGGKGSKREKRFWRRNKKQGTGGGPGSGVSDGTAGNGGPGVIPDIWEPQQSHNGNRHNCQGSKGQDTRKTSLDRRTTGNKHLAGPARDDPNASGSTCVGPRVSHHSVAGNGNGIGGVKGTDEIV